MWSIDRIEGGYALCEDTVTGEVCRIAAAELPQGAVEGALLRRTPSGWQRDEEAERACRRRLAEKSRGIFGSSPFANQPQRRKSMNITVYLGSGSGSDPKLEAAVRALGRWIGESGNALVYGGSHTGLMGALAESTLQAGGEVTGVEVSFFVEENLQYNGLTRLLVAEDLPQRRTKMIELGDAFIACPGGVGTLEEISEVISRVAIKKLEAPCILYNLDGYYEGLRAQLLHMVKMGLCAPEKLADIHFAADLEEIKAVLEAM